MRRLLAALLVLSACVRDDATSARAVASTIARPRALRLDDGERAPTDADSARVRQARAALAAYLEASRETAADHAALDTLAGCGDWSGEYLPISMLATYEVLAPAIRGDTVIGRAAVVTVAEQSADRRAPGRYVARLRVRTDTLEWDVVPDAEAGRWYVCNGLRFGYYGPDSLTTWRPTMFSYRAARALADSLGRR